jgi:hypothetical protein
MSDADFGALAGAELQFQLVNSVLNAMHTADLVVAGEATSQPISPLFCTPVDVYQPNCCPTPHVVYAHRQVIHPTPRYLPRPVIHPTPRYEPRPIVKSPEQDSPAPITPGLPPPWKTLPLNLPPHIPPTVKIVNRVPDITTRGTLIDFFC